MTVSLPTFLLCAYSVYMDQLNESFKEALEGSTLTVREVADELGYSERAVHAYRAGDRRVPPEVARRFAAYLRTRSKALQLLAQRLDDAASAKEGAR